MNYYKLKDIMQVAEPIPAKIKELRAYVYNRLENIKQNIQQKEEMVDENIFINALIKETQNIREFATLKQSTKDKIVNLIVALLASGSVTANLFLFAHLLNKLIQED